MMRRAQCRDILFPVDRSDCDYSTTTRRPECLQPADQRSHGVIQRVDQARDRPGIHLISRGFNVPFDLAGRLGDLLCAQHGRRALQPMSGPLQGHKITAGEHLTKTVRIATMRRGEAMKKIKIFLALARKSGQPNLDPEAGN